MCCRNLIKNKYRKGSLAVRLRFAFAALCLIVLPLGQAFAQPFTPYSEIWRKSQVFEPRPSLDTTPVTVRVVSVVYRIPRNYLTRLEPVIPTLRLT